MWRWLSLSTGSRSRRRQRWRVEPEDPFYRADLLIASVRRTLREADQRRLTGDELWDCWQQIQAAEACLAGAR